MEGDAGVGKSSLVQKFVNNSFSNHYSPTVEDCYSHNINLPGKY
jgi:GTPase SAR1 family protein